MITFIKEKSYLTLCEKGISPNANNWLCYPWQQELQSSLSAK